MSAPPTLGGTFARLMVGETGLSARQILHCSSVDQEKLLRTSARGDFRHAGVRPALRILWRATRAAGQRDPGDGSARTASPLSRECALRKLTDVYGDTGSGRTPEEPALRERQKGRIRAHAILETCGLRRHDSVTQMGGCSVRLALYLNAFDDVTAAFPFVRCPRHFSDHSRLACSLVAAQAMA